MSVGGEGEGQGHVKGSVCHVRAIKRPGGTRLTADVSVRACHPTPDTNACEGRTEEGEFGKGLLGLGHGKRKSGKDDDSNI